MNIRFLELQKERLICRNVFQHISIAQYLLILWLVHCFWAPIVMHWILVSSCFFTIKVMQLIGDRIVGEVHD